MAPWLIWLIAGGVLLGVELASLDLVFLMLAGGAGAGAAAAALGAPPVVQVVVFALVALALMFGVRPIARRHLEDTTPGIRTGTAALEGASALVLEAVDTTHGQVKIGGEVWTARPYDETQQLESGDTVQVMAIRGATALVWKSS